MLSIVYFEIDLTLLRSILSSVLGLGGHRGVNATMIAATLVLEHFASSIGFFVKRGRSTLPSNMVCVIDIVVIYYPVFHIDTLLQISLNLRSSLRDETFELEAVRAT